jgi:hypothetical protein
MWLQPKVSSCWATRFSIESGNALSVKGNTSNSPTEPYGKPGRPNVRRYKADAGWIVKCAAVHANAVLIRRIYQCVCNRVAGVADGIAKIKHVVCCQAGIAVGLDGHYWLNGGLESFSSVPNEKRGLRASRETT